MEKLAGLAGIAWPLGREITSTQIVLNTGQTDSLKFPLQTDYRIVPGSAEILLKTAGKNSTPFLVRNKNVAVINTHTFSQADFDAVGEVLLCPAQIGLLELPRNWMNAIRQVFSSEDLPELDAPSRVTFQQLDDGSIVMHNNPSRVTVRMKKTRIMDGWFHRTAVPAQ